MKEKVALDTNHVYRPPQQSHPHIRPHPNGQIEDVPVDLSQDQHHDRQVVEVCVLKRRGMVVRSSLSDLEVEHEHSLQKSSKGEQCECQHKQRVDRDCRKRLLQRSRQITRKAPHDYHNINYNRRNVGKTQIKNKQCEHNGLFLYMYQLLLFTLCYQSFKPIINISKLFLNSYCSNISSPNTYPSFSFPSQDISFMEESLFMHVQEVDVSTVNFLLEVLSGSLGAEREEAVPAIERLWSRTVASFWMLRVGDDGTFSQSILTIPPKQSQLRSLHSCSISSYHYLSSLGAARSEVPSSVSSMETFLNIWDILRQKEFYQPLCLQQQQIQQLRSSLPEGLLLHTIIELRRRVHVPHRTLVGKVGVIEESVTGLTVAYHAACVISEGIVEQLLIAPDVLPAV